jgi:Kef-type K+ transport system membrane component KefB
MEEILRDISIIMIASAVLSYVAVRMRQPIILGYIVAGVIFGPAATRIFGDSETTRFFLISNVEFISHTAKIGITLLLFLAGITLHPSHLLEYGRTTLIVTTLCCISSAGLAWLVSMAFGFCCTEALLISLAMMFSSTILVVKLLPTTTLHHERMGAICISILVAQDLIAVGVLVFMGAAGGTHALWLDFLTLFASAAGLLGVALLAERYLIRRIMKRMDKFREALFVISLGWCLAVTVGGVLLGLSAEVGAFFAGIALARQKVALFISEKLKPLRDFFLVLFFFILGAELDIFVIPGVIIPAMILAVIFLTVKPYLLFWFFQLGGLKKSASKEAAIRLGQLSEFSLLIAIIALESDLLSTKGSNMLQLAVIVTMIVSTYYVVETLPTPLAIKTELRKD